MSGRMWKLMLMKTRLRRMVNTWMWTRCSLANQDEISAIRFSRFLADIIKANLLTFKSAETEFAKVYNSSVLP